MSKVGVLPKIEEIAGRVTEPLGIEVVEIELKGGGKNQFLRVSIDKPEGVTHDGLRNCFAAFGRGTG